MKEMEVFARYKLPLLLGVGSAIAIASSLIILVQSSRPSSPIEFSSESATRSATLKIDVEGAVALPGLYTLPEGSRVDDAIVAAGGLSQNADADALAKIVNRAMKLVDGGKLFIPIKGAVSSVHTGLISVNSGSASELESLPGVGAVTAKKIIDARPYQTLEELVTKKAVGQALFEKINTAISL